MTTNAETARTTEWQLDQAHSLIEFSAKHMMITIVKGRLGEVTGTIWVNEADPSRSRVEVEMNAASVDTRAQQRDDHLRSADFLDVEKYPTITFRSTRIEGAHAKVGDSFRVVGDLTIRGTTREVVLDATFEGTGRDPWGGERASFSGTTKIDRRDFGLKWNQALETGGVLVGNELRLSVEVQAVKGSRAPQAG